MKNEGEFNQHLGKQVHKMSPEFKAVKTSDRYQLGISDFMIYGNGKAMAVESKFIKKWPTDKSKLLKHPFSGPQITYLEDMLLTGNRAFGVIGIEETKEIYCIPSTMIPKDGNWNTKDFRDNNHLVFQWNHFDMFVEGM